MESIDFPEANLAVAKDQPEYKTLYVHATQDSQFAMTCCLKLSKEELEEVNKTGVVYFTQITFGRGYAPIRMSVTNPFVARIDAGDKQPADENRTPVDEWDRTHFIDSHTSVVHQSIGPCINCGKDWEHHFWSSRQCNL